MKIKEIFYSLQGEGGMTGRPAVFVRFSGCNLACPFCDTDFKGGDDYTEDEPEMFVTIYERQYDSHGNWTRCTEFEIVGDRRIPTYTTIREIDYF